MSTARAVVFAYHDVGVRCLKTLISAGIEIPLVVTVKDDPHETRWFASVAATANPKILQGIFILHHDILLAVRALAIFVAVSTGMFGQALENTAKQYCQGCHNDKLKTGGISLANVSSNVADQAPVLEKVLHKIRAGEMPPTGMPRPDAATTTPPLCRQATRSRLPNV